MSDPDPITRLNAALEGRYHIERELVEPWLCDMAQRWAWGGSPHASPDGSARRNLATPRSTETGRFVHA